MKYLIGALSALVLLFIGGVIYIYSGIYNISALEPHNKITLWMINTLKDNSVEHYSDSKLKTPNLSDTSLIKTGFIHYREMCVGCHGAPGIEQGEGVLGFYPKPPKLTEVVKDWTPQQLFWIIKNGIKMSGMPAFGITHTDEMIWAMVAFSEKLPNITKEQYQTFDKETKGEKAE